MSTLGISSSRIRILIACAALSGCPSAHPSGAPDAGGAAVASCVGSHAPHGLTSSLLANQILSSDYIFRGTVTQVHAQTVPDMLDTTNLAVVHVAVALDARHLDGYPGAPFVDRDVTLDVQGSAFPPVGEDGIFLTTIEEYNGGELEVRQIVRLDPAAVPTFADDLVAIEAAFTADPLYARLASADLVVSGTVTTVTPIDTPCGSEHCPMWATAMIDVDQVLCGTPSMPLSDAFASSNDVAWDQAPKLTVAQTGVFLIHHADRPLPFSLPDGGPAHLTIDPLDVQPSSAWPSLQALYGAP